MPKINLSTYLFKLIFFFLILQQTFEVIPPETDFKPLSSRELSYFQLTKEKNEVYYSFENKYEASDIILNFKIGKGFTSYCYIYDSYEKISQDDKGQYINAIKDFQITENDFILKDSNLTIKETKYYIIIKDIINSFYKDYISIFNEQDTIVLTNEQYIQFSQFYSKNLFNLEFTHKKNEVATLELNINNSDFPQIITVYNEAGELIYQGEKNKGEIRLNEDLDNESKYTIEIESEEEPYTLIQSSIVLHLEERKSKELKYETPLNLAYNGNKEFYFYVNLSQYELNEENIITFKFGKQILERNLLSHCFAKTMNLDSNNDDKLIANMPVNEDENEAILSRLTGTNDIYELYFKNTKEKVENKTTYLLIYLSIHIDSHDADDFLEPEEFNIYLSNKPEIINLADYKDKTHFIYNKNLQLNNYVPIIYKIVFPSEEYAISFSYLFYTSDLIQTVYNNTLLNSQEHLNEKKMMLYAISPSQEEYFYTKVLYIKLFGFNSKEINMRIESTESSIYYINNIARKIKTFSDKLTDCSKSIYYIGDYGSLAVKGYFYEETLYGKINVYYKGVINPSDQSILINDDPSFLKDSFFPLETYIDIVELKCEMPGFYQAHLVDDVDQRNINLYSKVYNYLPAGKNFTITPVLSPISEDINFEIYNPTGKSLKISDGDTIQVLDKDNKYYQVKYNNYSLVPQCFTVLSEDNSIISITMTNMKPFVIIEDGKMDVEYDSQIIVKLLNKLDYTTVNVEINRIYHGYSFSLFKGNVDFSGKLIESEFDYIKAEKNHKINMIISNPYLLESNEINNDIVYYLIYSIDDPEQIQKQVKLNYKPKEEHEKINLEEKRTIPKESDIYTLPSNNINLIFQSCCNSLKEIIINDLTESIIQTIPNEHNDTKYNYEKVTNYNKEVNMNIKLKNSQTDVLPELKGAVIGITEKQITQERIDYYTNLKLNVNIEKGKLEWETIEQMNNYDIYVLDQNNTYIPYLNNPCLLQTLKNNYSFHSFNDNNTYIKHYQSDVNYISLKEQGIYIIAITANINEFPLLYIYEPFLYNSSYVPPHSDDTDSDNPDDDDNSGTILFLAIALPIVVVGVLILIFALIKCKKKNNEEQRDNNEGDEKIVPIVRPSNISRVTALNN